MHKTEGNAGTPLRERAAYFLLAISLLNLGGMLTVLTQPAGKAHDTLSSLSYFVFAGPIVIYLILKYARISLISGAYASFTVFLLSYLIIATSTILTASAFSSHHVVSLAVYLFQLALISAVYFWSSALSDKAFEDALRVVKAILFVGSLSIVFSFSLPFYEGAERAGGFYIDQNHAATVALLTIVLAVAHPARSSAMALLQISIPALALVMTLSRTGLLSFFILFALYLIAKRSLATTIVSASAAAAAIFIGWLLIESELLHLTSEQLQRVADIANLFTGETTQKTYDQRDGLFDIGIDRIMEAFPFGNGFGEFHALEYGYRHRVTGEWLGVHNTFLMLAGEAGVVAIILFLVFWISLLVGVMQRSQFRVFAIGSIVVILLIMLTTHSVLNDKVVGTVLGLLISIAVRGWSPYLGTFAPSIRVRT